ncbi:hypothetical protein [Amycolatopsis orientalis]|uniref:hypothetical protein n=1 Tax=Amycolatopsis orientalis TaxID=31958 RepID=UPI001319E7B4|nr:hypothetical protein [Amycolatopsis orientalis]
MPERAFLALQLFRLHFDDPPALFETGETAGELSGQEDVSDDPPGGEFPLGVLSFVAPPVGDALGFPHSQLGGTQFHPKAVGLRSPRRRTGLPARAVVVVVQLLRRFFLKAQRRSRCFRVGNGRDSTCPGRCGRAALLAGLVVCDGEAEERLDDFLPEVQLLLPARPGGGVGPEDVDAVRDLLHGRSRHGGADEPLDELVGVGEPHDPIDAALGGVHDGLEANLVEIDADGVEPPAPVSLVVGRQMRWYRTAGRQHGTHAVRELVAGGPPPGIGPERKVVDGRPVLTRKPAVEDAVEP